MTREDAINKVRQMSLPKETMEILEALAPELKEREDERIRKHLIEIVETYWGTTNEPGKAADLAWLEKQKEQKPISSCDIVPYIDDKIAALQDMWREEKVAFDWDDMHEMIEDVARHFYQKEQKPKLYWHKIKAYEKLPCKAYIYKQAFEQENNFFGKATIPGFMAPNIPCGIGCDTWYLPVDDIKNLPKEGEDEQKPYEEHDCPKGNPLQEQLNADARKAEDQLIGFIHDLISKLSWRKDWTISKEECLRRLNDYCPQKPTEWSEVELEFRGEKVKVKRPFFRDDKGRGYSTTAQDEDVAWYALRAWCEKKGVSLYDLYPRTEWSEEDEKKINFLSRLIEFQVKDDEYCFGDGRLISKQEAIEMLKSLRSHPKSSDNWKPSKEQMKALLNAEGYLREGDQFDSAKSIAQLYEQLKRL